MDLGWKKAEKKSDRNLHVINNQTSLEERCNISSFIFLNEEGEMKMRSNITNNVAGNNHPIITAIPSCSFTYKHDTKHLASQMGISVLF